MLIAIVVLAAVLTLGFFYVKSHKDQTTAELKRLEDRINRL